MNQEAQPIVNRVIPIKITTKSKSNLQAPTKNHDSGTEVSLSLTPSSSHLFEQQIKVNMWLIIKMNYNTIVLCYA